MKAYVIVAIIFFVFGLCAAVDQIDFNFFNEVKADFYDFNKFLIFQEKTVSDTIPAVNIFSGRVLDSYEGDIFTLAWLNYVQCDLASPTDLRFNVSNSGLSFDLLASNILSDSLDIIPYKIIETDSMKIGIFSIYTPDFAVKNKLSSKIQLDPHVFGITRTLSKFLSEKTDLVIMISSLSRFIIKDIVKDLPIDAVLSSDYQEKNDGWLNGNVRFYSTRGNMKKYGRLRLIYHKGEVEFLWSEEAIKLDVEAEPVQDEEKDAAGNR